MEAAGPNFGVFTLTEGTLLFRPRVEAEESLTDMVGTSWVTLIEGAVDPLLSAGVSLTDMLGRGGALFLDPRLGAGDSLTEMLGVGGTWNLEPRLEIGDSLTEMLGTGGVGAGDGLRKPLLGGPLTEIDGVSETEIEGIGGDGVVRERAGEESGAFMVGIGVTEGRVGILPFLNELTSGRGRTGAGDSS